MSKRSKRAKVRERILPKPKRRAKAFAIVVAAIAILLAATGIFHFRDRPTVPKKMPAAELAPIYAKLDAIIEKAKIGVTGEPDAENLLNEFAKNTVMGKMSSFGQVEAVARNAVFKSNVALVVFVGKEELKYVPEAMPSPFMFVPQIQAVVLADLEPMNNETLAVLLIHEIFHWRAFLNSGRRIDTDPYTRARLLEEVMAHELETRAANRITGGGFLRALNEALNNDALSLRNETGYRVLTQTGADRLLAVWHDPPQSRMETNIRVSIAAIALRFAQIPDPDNRIRAYAQIRRESMSQDFRK